MKKLIAVILASLMVASVLLACGGGGGTTTTKAPETTTKEAETTAPKTEETTTTQAETTKSANPEKTYHAIFMYNVANENWPHQQQVNDYVKQLCIDELNIECELMPMSFSTKNAQLPLMLAANQQLDVFSQSYPQDYLDQGYILDLMDYKEYIQPAIDWIGEDEIMASLRNGKLAGLPTQLERTHRYGMAMRTDILKEVGIDPETMNGNIEEAYDNCTAIFEKVRAKYPEMVLMGGPNNSPPPNNYQHTDYMGDGYGVLDDYGSTFTVTNYFESPYFKKSCEYMKKWFDAGYIQKDIAVATDSYESLVKAGNTFGGCCPMKPDSYAEKRDQCNHDMSIFYFREDMMLAYSGGGWSVSGTAKDPVQAARLLNFAFTSTEFNDAINWGVPDLDWVEVEPNVAYYPEGMDVSNQGYHNSYGWAYPNERIAHVWKGNAPNMYTEIYPAAEKDSHRTIAYGFVWDNSDHQDTIAALNNIKSEYLYKVASGDVPDMDAEIKKFNDRLYSSGLQSVMDAKQEQLDAWRKANGK
jgi:putative aldouronate transport system substrate-binding protein